VADHAENLGLSPMIGSRTPNSCGTRGARRFMTSSRAASRGRPTRRGPRRAWPSARIPWKTRTS
jgi:hypothetical protein